MSNNADDDVAIAISQKWDANKLSSTILGGLEQDRGTSAQPEAQPRADRKLPYALFRVTKHADPDFSTGYVYIDHRLVTIEVRGLKADVSAAVDLIRATYMPANFAGRVLSFPPDQCPNVVGGQAMAVLEVGEDELHKDAAIRQGEDIWLGVVAMHVITHRQYGKSS